MFNYQCSYQHNQCSIISVQLSLISVHISTISVQLSVFHYQFSLSAQNLGSFTVAIVLRSLFFASAGAANKVAGSGPLDIRISRNYESSWRDIWKAGYPEGNIHLSVQCSGKAVHVVMIQIIIRTSQRQWARKKNLMWQELRVPNTRIKQFFRVIKVQYVPCLMRKPKL